MRFAPYKLKTCITAAVMIWALAGGALWAQDGENMPGTGLRLENELKIPVPDEWVDRVWDYVQSRYADDTALWGSKLDTSVSIELFVDTYYDTPDKQFLSNQNGLRHRWRKFPNGDIKELVQIKLTQAQGNSTRGELKYAVRPDRDPRDAMDNHVLMRMMVKSDRAAFINDMESLGADPNSLSRSLVLTQNRHRVYIKEAATGQSLATLTLDHMDGRIGWLTHKGVELELELNEFNYTAATPEERRRMEAFNDAILADLQRQFPVLKVDLTPKYNKSHALLKSRHPLQYHLAVNPGLLLMAALLGIGAILAPLAVKLLRKPRPRPHSAAPAAASSK